MNALASISSLALIGAGKMGCALLEGWLRQGLPSRSVLVRDPFLAPAAQHLLAQHGIAAQQADRPVDVLVIAVKPQALDAMLPSLLPLIGAQTLVLSVVAGKRISSYTSVLGDAAALVRVMPNTPAAVGRGMSVCLPTSHVTPAQRLLADSLLSCVGDVVWIADEAQMDAVTALSGSGPAYVFLLAEVMAQAGEALGLAPDVSARLARQTVSGAGELLFQSDLDAATLRQNVTSPNGTTAAALDVLMHPHGMAELMTRAMLRASERSKELSQ